MKKSKFKRILASVIASAMCVAINASAVFTNATDDCNDGIGVILTDSSDLYFAATSSGKSFTSAWEVADDIIEYGGVEIGIRTYGYKTGLLTNQDYNNCYFYDHNCVSEIYRSGYDTTVGSQGTPAVWSYCTVTHKTSTITYYQIRQ